MGNFNKTTRIARFGVLIISSYNKSSQIKFTKISPVAAFGNSKKKLFQGSKSAFFQDFEW